MSTEELMFKGAMKVVTVCAGIRSGEKVLIVTDPERYRAASILAAASRAIGVEPVVTVMAPNELDGQEPQPLVASLMMSGEVDVLFMIVTRSIGHSRAAVAALRKGARSISMTKFELEQYYRGGLLADFEAQKPRCDEMARRMSGASSAHLTTPAGTDIRFDLAGRSANSHSGIVRNPGDATALVHIEANIAPNEGISQGRVVVDGSIPNFDVGVIHQPVVLEVRAGNVVSIEGGAQASALRRVLARNEGENIYNIAQLAVGLNPECIAFNGMFSNDHGVDGSCHIGIGTSESIGGSLRAELHFDVMMSAPTLRLDGAEVIRDGNVVI
jgi:leucyl aminopeptidase (aminopeptidase T)